MRSYYPFLFVIWGLCLSHGLFAQDTPIYEVRGVVQDSTLQETLPFANVFFSGTTYGTTSNKDGVFSLKPAVPGTYDLVISFLGYKPYRQKINLNTPGLVEITINMKPEARFLGGVTVVAKKDNAWKKNLKKFKEIFLGTSINSKSCVITNEDILHLEYDEETGIFEAYAGEPLIIENKALGYKITYVLETFKIYYKEGYSAFSGYPSFKEMTAGSRRFQKAWERARDRTYLGSIEHFFRELYHGKSFAAGFRVNQVVSYDLGRRTRRTQIRADSLVRFSEDGIRKELAFQDAILVTYIHEGPQRAYQVSLSQKAPPALRYANEQISWIEMPEGEEKLVFEKTGYWVNPLPFLLEGYWSFEKMADLLPLDYNPTRSK